MIKFSYIAVFVFLANVAFSQKYSFISYSTKQGLAQSQVYDIVQDDQNYIWIATLDGLSKFNGQTFQNFYEKDGLLSNKIFSLSVCPNNLVWAITPNGISIVKRDTVIDFEHNNLFEDKEIIEAIHQGDKVYIATKYSGVYVFKINKESQYDPVHVFKKNLEGLSLNDIHLDGYKLYLATSGGLFQILNTQLSQVELPWELSISSVGVTKMGKLWLGSLQNGVFFVEKNRQLIVSQANSDLLNDFTTSLTVDRNGNAWVSSNSALSEINQLGKVESYISTNGFDFSSSVVYEDREGNIWIGTDGDGLIKFANKEFKFLTKSEELPANVIISIGQDATGDMWLGSYGEGVSRISDDNITSYNARQTAFPNNNCWAIHRDLKGKMWFGTSEGLACFVNNKFQIFTKENGLPNNKVQALFQESEEVMWIGTKTGVAYLKDGVFNSIENYEFPNTRSIVSTEDGMYWFGTSEGLVSYDGFETNLVNDSLVVGATIYALSTFGNSLFIGSEKGLFHFDGASFTPVNFSSEIVNSVINFLTIDNESTLWIGTNKGTFRLDLPQYFEGKKQVESYTINNGLIGMETNLNAIFQDRDNNVWIGTSEGINVYKKSAIEEENEINLTVHFTDVKLFFEEENYLSKLSAQGNYNFQNKQNTITFYFHTNYFKDPLNVRYSYKLEGSDEAWSPMDRTDFSRYPNLPHGNYTFKVKSTIDGKTWSEVEELNFTIKTPYWLTWWFRISVLALLFGVILYLILRRRNTLKNEREVELLNYKNKLIKLEQQSLNASMNRHFIFNSLNSIQFYINKEDKLSANRYLSNFSKLIRKNLDSSSAEDSLIPLSEEIERLTLYLSLENMRFKEKFTYQINLSEEVDAEMTKVPAMFMQPFIENSIWHGILPKEEPGLISIDIFKEGKSTVFELTDNGIGISTSIKNKSDEQNEHSSKGVKIAINRIELLQKVIEKEIFIEGPVEMSENGKILGTKVRIVFG